MDKLPVSTLPKLDYAREFPFSDSDFERIR